MLSYNYTFYVQFQKQIHIILGMGDFTTDLEFSEKGVMGDVAASPNDPLFINHHTMIDCILEAWLQQDNGASVYPMMDDEIHDGHRANDYIVPFIPLYTHSQMFKTANNFGYECTLPDLTSCDPDPDPSPETEEPKNKAISSTVGYVYLASLLAALLSILVIGSI